MAGSTCTSHQRTGSGSARGPGEGHHHGDVNQRMATTPTRPYACMHACMSGGGGWTHVVLSCALPAIAGAARQSPPLAFLCGRSYSTSRLRPGSGSMSLGSALRHTSVTANTQGVSMMGAMLLVVLASGGAGAGPAPDEDGKAGGWGGSAAPAPPSARPSPACRRKLDSWNSRSFSVMSDTW